MKADSIYTMLNSYYQNLLSSKKEEDKKQVILYLIKNGFSFNEVESLFNKYNPESLHSTDFYDIENRYFTEKRIFDIGIDFIWHSILEKTILQDLTDKDRAVLLLLISKMKFVGNTAITYSEREIAKKAGKDRKTINKSISRLIVHGIISKYGEGYTNSYRLNTTFVNSLFSKLVGRFIEMGYILQHYSFYSIHKDNKNNLFIVLENGHLKTLNGDYHNSEMHEKIYIESNHEHYPILSLLHEIKLQRKRLILTDLLKQGTDLHSYGGLSKSSIPLINFINNNTGKWFKLKEVRESAQVSKFVYDDTLKKIGFDFYQTRGNARSKEICFTKKFGKRAENIFIKEKNLYGRIEKRNKKLTKEQLAYTFNSHKDTDQ